MSMEFEGPTPPEGGLPQLSELGWRIEMLRLERRLSKQHLARFAGTSRQQLWRVMTGKSELTGTLRLRLAEALGVDPQTFSSTTSATAAPAEFAEQIDLTFAARPPVSIAALVEDTSRLESLLATLPPGGDGRHVKRALLDAIEDVALERGLPLPTHFFDVRRRVLARQL